MRLPPARFLSTTISALLLAFIATMPVNADTSLDESGTTGSHSLRDSESGPGYSCHYKGIYPPQGGDYNGKINRIDVRPPRMKAISGRQEVGWRFIVERRKHVDASPVWMVRYTSSIQRDTTSSSRNASFSIRDVDVRLPANGAHEDTIYEYRVKVKMFWYTADGGVQGTSTHLADWYNQVLHNMPYGGAQTFRELAPCRGWVSASIN